jgi:hypothetical protein
VIQNGNQGRVTLHGPIGILAKYGCLHPIIEHLTGGTIPSGKCDHETAQHCLQLLADSEAPPEPTAVTQHEREQPDFAHARRVVRKFHGELGKSAWACSTGSVSKTPLEHTRQVRAKGAKLVGHCGIASSISK